MSSRGEVSAPEQETLSLLRARVTELERRSQEQAEQLRQLASAERHYRGLFEQAEDGLFVADADGRYAGSNAALRALLGYSEEELRGKRIEDLLDPADLTRTPLRRRELKQNGRLVTSRVLRRKDGSSVHAEVVASFLEDGYVEAIVRDVSDRVHAEHERARLAEELRHAQKMESIGRLAGGIAHDFNNLLLVISANAHVLRRRQPELASPELAAIVAATERGTALTKQLLSLSRARVQALMVFDVNEVLRGMQDLMARLMGEGIALDFKLEAQPCLIAGDPSQLEQVIMNLLVNARDACEGRGRVVVATALKDSDGRTHLPREATDGLGLGVARSAPQVLEKDVIVEIRDWGHGMDSLTQSRIFEPFFTTKPAGVGTGLGLSMVYSIVSQSGGAISVHSVKGEGSVFELRFAALGGRVPRDAHSAAVGQPSAAQ